MSQKIMPQKATKKIVIIGGVAGGATAAAKARREDENAEITVIEKGRYVSFANCGLPYYIGREIKKREALLLQTPEGFWSRYRIRVLVESEVKEIRRSSKTLLVESKSDVEHADVKHDIKHTNTKHSETKSTEIPYDKLIISQGASPIIPPTNGSHLPHVFSLRDMNDMDKIDQYIEAKKPKAAVVVGGGFIGLEMAEALVHRGIQVHLVEKAPQVMALMDLEFGRLIAEELKLNKINLYLDNSIAEIKSDQVVLAANPAQGVVPADLVIFSIGVKPELELAKKCGLEMGAQGGLKVNTYLQTSDPDIYAVGDMVEVPHKILKKWVRVPLAGPANRQGRIAATNATQTNTICYSGTFGSSVVKVFDKTAAITGLSERAAKSHGFDVSTATVHPRHHAGYYPGAQQMSLQLVFERKTGEILGAQAFGGAGVEKRIDVIATALHGKMKVFDLEEIDLCYAPPYSSANDPVNMVGFVASNAVRGFSQLISAQDFASQIKKEISENATGNTAAFPSVVLDVREPSEYREGHWPKAQNVPLPELRDRLEELPKDKIIYVHCAVGFRGHLAYRILVQNGFTKVYNISGGFKSMSFFV